MIAMEHIHVHREGALAVLTMSRGKANALNVAMTGELLAAARDLAGDASVRGIVLASGQPKFFSAGFDIAEVFRLEKPQLEELFLTFGRLYEELFFAPKPVVAAVAGHCYAAGAILALTADVRVFAEGEAGFALNEIDIGVTLPEEVFRMLADATSPREARRMLLTGSAVKPAEALASGLADELAPAGQALARAIARTSELAAKPEQAFSGIKANARAAAGHARAAHPGPAADIWFTPGAIQRKTQMLEALAKR